MYEAEFKGLPRVQSELRHRHAGAGGVCFQTEWNNLELLKNRCASNSRQPNETPRALLINLHVRVGDRVQVQRVWRRHGLKRGGFGHFFFFFCTFSEIMCGIRLCLGGNPEYTGDSFLSYVSAL